MTFHSDLHLFLKLWGWNSCCHCVVASVRGICRLAPVWMNDRRFFQHRGWSVVSVLQCLAQLDIGFGPINVVIDIVSNIPGGYWIFCWQKIALPLLYWMFLPILQFYMLPSLCSPGAISNCLIYPFLSMVKSFFLSYRSLHLPLCCDAILEQTLVRSLWCTAVHNFC